MHLYTHFASLSKLDTIQWDVALKVLHGNPMLGLRTH